MNYIIPLVIFTPLMMSLFIMSPLFSDDEKIIRRTAKGFSIFHFTLMILLTAFFNFSQSEFTIKTSYKWIEVLGINANFEFDSLSLLLTVLTSFIFLLSVFISKNMIKRSYRLYYSLIFVLQSAVTGVFGAGDLFLLFLFWELELIPMYLLLLKWGSGNKQKTAMKFLLYTFFGSIFIIAGFLLLYYWNFISNGILSSDFNNINTIFIPDGIKALIFVLLFIGFGIKLPVVPLHSWLPDVHTQAATPVSIILSSILLKMGAYGILRFNLQMLETVYEILAPFIMLLAAISIIYAGFCAINQKDIKRIIAYSGIAHMGIFLLGISSLNETGITGGIFQLFSHALISAGLFTIAGIIYVKCGTKNLLKLQGLGEKMPRLMLISIPVIFAGMGIPLLTGFVAEFLSFTGAFLFQSEGIINTKLITLIALSSVIFCSVYMLKIFHGLFFGEITKRLNKISDINIPQFAALAVIALYLIIFGIFPSILTNTISIYSTVTYNIAGVF